MTKISLVTPTRNRPNDLRRLLESIEATTKNKDEVEILFAYDKDDNVTREVIPSLIYNFPRLDIKWHEVERSDHFSKDYYNFLSLKAQGRWIMAINDDSVFMTPEWDRIIDFKMSDAADKAKDDILLGIVQDGMKRIGAEKLNPTMSCWLLSSKEYVTLMNGLLLEEIYTWGGDYWLGRVFCKVQYGQRKVYILDVFIDHNSHHLKDLPQPESFWLFKRIEEDHPCTCNEEVVAIKAKFINNYIAARKK